MLGAARGVHQVRERAYNRLEVSMRTTIGVSGGLLAALLGGCSGDGPNCNAGDLSAALAAALPGDTVEVGSCAVTGAFIVPAGVTLAGAGATRTRLIATTDGVAVTLTPGSQAAAIQDLTIETDGLAAIVATGDGTGAVTIARVTVEATRGIGVGLQDLASATISDLSLSGPVVAESADMLPPDPMPSQTATHGLVLVRVAGGSLANVMAVGFADFGVLIVDSTTDWAGGGATDNLGTNMMVYGGTATLTDLDLSRSLQGTRLIPPYGGVFASGADVTTERLRVDGGDRYGILQSGASAHHTDLVASGNRDAALWVQGSTGFGLVGPNSLISDNGFAGVVIVDSSDVTIEDATIEQSQLTTRPFGMTTVDIGDGVQLVRSTDNVLISRCNLVNNDRVGVLLDIGTAPVPVGLFVDVMVGGTGTQLGAIAQQNGLVVMPGTGGWDMGITRDGPTGASDAARTTPLDTVGVGLIGPNSVDVPSAVEMDGIDSLLVR